MNLLQIKKLIQAGDAGADPGVTFQGKSLVEIAEEKGNQKILESLRERGEC